MPYLAIEDYGIIGNLRTVALVGVNGSIDWYCSPNFDSPSIFGAMLDDRKGGRFQIAPIAEEVRHKQFYWPSTNILVTRFSHADGIAELVDFMPVGFADDSPSYHQLYRTVRCVRGTVRLGMVCKPAFDYGRASHEVEIRDGGALFKAGGGHDQFSLAAKVSLKIEDGGVSADFVLEEGQSKTFVFQNDDGTANRAAIAGSEDESKETFEQTVKFWQDWLSACTYRGRWRERIERSALSLKLLTFEPTGAIVAAPTTSLPEVIGGSRNWDYRYSWVRDAAFTVYAFVRLGFTSEASGFVNWLQNYVAKHPHTGEQLPTVFTIYGEQVPDEIILDHWEGYMGSGPVRIGNAANHQYQADIYGELMDSLYLYNKHVGPINYDFWVRIRRRLDWICDNWQLPDEGIWEMRSGKQNFVYSKLMNWVALDRGVRLAEKRSFPGNRVRWLTERDAIYEEVMTKGWNEKRQAFTQYYGSEDLDAGTLIMPLVFFMAPSDPRMISTIKAILQKPRDGGLVSDGLVYRYPPQPRVDGLPGEEGTFNMCSFWLVEALTRAGQTNPSWLDEARLLFERMLNYANHLGLYAEQTSAQGQALGNYPQAFTHLALISAAFNLDRTLGKN
ncbi:MAG TPA: glycoside hydrolase family 15 protein [Candidatus Sulfotelmatobacter sp.]|nr:glycoside hydrolase family 15 protein [Candidatus Sulfotelmatobacter sp.]